MPDDAVTVHRTTITMVVLAFTAALLAAGEATAATGPYLVKDIRATGASQPYNLTVVGDTLFFAANGQGGRELWKSDGTSTGTVRVKNIRPGSAGSSPNNLTNVDGTLYFTANDGSHGFELWRSDGTGSGTWMVADISPGPEHAYPSAVTDVDGTLYFFRDWPVVELWKSDGTGPGTELVELLNPAEPSSPGHGREFAFDGRFWFYASLSPADTSQQWVSDGTADGTHVFAGSGDLMSFREPTQVGSTFYFPGTDATHGTELWKSTDGTLAGAHFVKDVRPGPNSAFPQSSPFEREMIAGPGGLLYFSAQDDGLFLDLWKSNGTGAGTKQLTIGATDLIDDAPLELTPFKNGIMFTTAYTSPLWKSNGTRAGTKALTTEVDGAGWLEAAGSTLVFTGTVLESGMVAAVPPHDTELWATDGTSAGTHLVMDINPAGDSIPRDLTAVGNGVFFTANDGTHGRELWRYIP